MQHDLFTSQQFPLACCLEGKCYREGTGPGSAAARAHKEPRGCKQGTSAPPCATPGKDFGARLCAPQQGTNIILSALSSAQVFLLPRSVT